ncbi:MAG: hypothetical protein ACTSUS_03615 [Candidatus Freyarchaeota archaeon]
MNEEFLVFRGMDVWYYPETQEIKCISKEDCFAIKETPAIQILAFNTTAIGYSEKGIAIHGNELWSNGTQYIIKYNPSTDKNQTKPPKTPNQNLENLSTYEDAVARIR